jgi:hypothetical protein
MAEEGVQREHLIFATLHGYVPWDDRAPQTIEMNKRSAALNEAKAQELKMAALEAANEVIEAKAAVEDNVPTEILESVNLPEDPGAHGGGGRGR